LSRAAVDTESADPSRFSSRQRAMTPFSPLRQLTPLDWMLVLLMLGYLCMSRSFAHWGAPPLFVGEAVLIAFVLLRPGVLIELFGNSLTSSSAPLSGLAWWYFLFLAFGIIELLRGLNSGHPRQVAVQCFVFNVYPLFCFMGIWLGRRHPDLIPSMIRLFAWVHGIYGTFYLAVLSHGVSPHEMEMEEAIKPPLFGQPEGAALLLLGLIAFERKLSRMWLPLALNSFVLLGGQVRAELVGFVAAIVLLCYLTRRLAILLKVGAVIGGLLLVGYITDFKIEAPALRGGVISSRQIVGRIISASSGKAATKYMSAEDAENFESTVTWRTGWWHNIWHMVHTGPDSGSTLERILIGPGYGYPIWLLHPEDLGDVPIRTPHNVFMYALAYTGWLGVTLFYGLQFCLASLLWRVYRRTGQPFGLCAWLLFMVWSFFDNFFETPFGAIPFFLLTGLATAPILGDNDTAKQLEHPTAEEVIRV
jgi:hypothetical protein